MEIPMRTFKQYITEVGDETFKHGDLVMAKHDLKSGATYPGHVVGQEGDHVLVKHKYDNKVYKHHKDTVSHEFEKVNPNPYK